VGRRLLDWRSGGWAFLVSGVLCLVVLGQWVSRLSQRRPVVGDGRTVASYGFDLSTCLVPQEQFVAAGFPKDGLPALNEPELFTPAQMEEFNRALRRAHRGRFLVDSDRVVGVALAGQARAYPLRILSWHEVVNDTVGGQPIAVTYNPLCDSAVVFERRVGSETLEFGVSGLLYNSNLVMFDRRAKPEDESLWSQLQFRAVAGPAAVARRELAIVPAVLVHWSDWAAQHPDTTILAPVPERMELYGRSYEPYFGSDKLRFPVSPVPEGGSPHLKAPTIAVRLGEQWHVYTLAEIAGHVGAGATWTTEVAGAGVTFHYRADPPAAWVDANRTAVESVYAFWFAWYALHPEAAALGG
jgi:hypothetical protein